MTFMPLVVPTTRPECCAPRKRSRWRLRVLLAVLVVAVAAYVADQAGPGLALPGPSRSADDRAMVARAARHGGEAHSQGFHGGYFGIGGAEHILVVFRDTRLDDSGLERFAGAATPSLRDLRLLDTSLSDDGLTHLARVGAHRLEIGTQAARPRHPGGRGRRCRITPDGLAHLAGMRNLRTLNLRGMDLTGGGLRHLRHAKHLSSLILHDCRVGDDDLAVLAGACPGLTELDLDRSAITDDGLRGLAALKGLRSLSIGETGITDRGVRVLSTQEGLSRLSIVSTRGITRQGLTAMACIKTLRSLDAMGNGFHKDDVLSLRVANPELVIDLGPGGYLAAARDTP